MKDLKVGDKIKIYKYNRECCEAEVSKVFKKYFVDSNGKNWNYNGNARPNNPYIGYRCVKISVD